jgi:predicted DsbA family dithiol-disulfide isomerase
VKLKIEMVHDIVCSWCPIGYRNIQKAIENLAIEVDFHFLPFELNPEMSEEGETIANYFKRQQGWNKSTLLDYQASLVKTARAAGVNIDFSKRTHYYNTRNAHKLIHFAESFDKQLIANEHLIEAYFKNGIDISNTNALLDIAEEIGLDRAAAKDALSSIKIEQSLEKKINRQKDFKILSIPAFILNEETLISGSNSVEVLEDILLKYINRTIILNK